MKNEKKTLFELFKDFDLLTLVNYLSPSFESIQFEVDELRSSYPKMTNEQLAKKYANRIRKKYTSLGVASALPSTIPGFGTAAQIFQVLVLQHK